METALFENRIVSVEGFLRAQSSPSEYPTCPVCNEQLSLSATRSVKKAASFNHQPRAKDVSRCPLSYSYHPSYSWLDDVDLEEIESRATSLRASFYQLDNLKRAFMFLSRMAGKGAISHDVFTLLLKRAEKFNIWRYAALPLWAVPYLLLTLTDFYIRREGKRTYVVRFIIEKTSRSKLNTTWLHPGQCNLVKYFVNKGKATNVFGVQPSYARKASMLTGVGLVKNPMPFSAADFNALAADTTWIRGGLESYLRDMTVTVLDTEGGAVAPRYPLGGEESVEAVRPHEPTTAAVKAAEVSSSQGGDATLIHTSALSHSEKRTGIERASNSSKLATEAARASGAPLTSDYSRASDERGRLTLSSLLVRQPVDIESTRSSDFVGGGETGEEALYSSRERQAGQTAAGLQTPTKLEPSATKAQYATRSSDNEATNPSTERPDALLGLPTALSSPERVTKSLTHISCRSVRSSSRCSGFWAWVKSYISR